MKQTIVLAATMLLLGSSLVGCSNGSRLPETLEERVQLRWDSLVGSDIETAYRLLSPGFREAVSLEAYRARLAARTIQWTGTQFVEVKSCEGEVCTVKVDIGFLVLRPMPSVPRYESSRRTEERWIREGGAWYHVPDRLN